MGSFTTLYSYISNRVLPQPPTTHHHENKENYSSNDCNTATNRIHQQRYFSDSASALVQKESTHQLFPCEEQHTFNPHYQHNLHSTSPSYSVPPSLSSSPTNSSPSSTVSSSSRSHSAALSHSLLQSGQKPYYQQQPQSRRQPQQQQQHQQHQRNRSYSYNCQQARLQNQRNHAQQQQHYEFMDDDLLIGYDSHNVYYGSGATASMTRVHPNGSPSSLFSSSASDRQQQQQQQQNRRTSHISYSSSRSSETERVSLPVSRSAEDASYSSPSSERSSTSSTSYAHGLGLGMNRRQQQQQQQQQHNNNKAGSYILPSISETTATMYLQEHGLNEEDSVSHRPALTSTSTSKPSAMTAKQSLMRIAQCDIRQDGWCSSQSGQWTRHYAETRPCGIFVEGRRARRM
ncbi:hypothetical protein BG011_004507 [Mortierella polycephala]|uniref:Uncharacterized protein n=1 Tax=Mortierella polycephala TaxID=41804 RepID=A0A9P6PYB2_9FUNG|nr:hypothetical protein BG011_004507 [Mortierella polycephala]